MNSEKNANAAMGARIREVRVKRNMTQEVLAEKAGICNPQQMSNIERGTAGISLARFKDICTVLDVDADYLLFGTSKRGVENALSAYMEHMNHEQIADLLQLVKLYAKACGIDE